MKFPEACDVKLERGKYVGRTIADVGNTGEGLLYLDWVSGVQATSNRVALAVAVFLADKHIAAELEALVGWPGEAEKGGNDEL